MATVPETILGLGGAGKNTVYQLFNEEKNEWVIEEATEHPNKVQAYLVDTDTSQAPRDRDRVEEINERIDRVTETEGTGKRKPSVDYVNIVEETNSPFTSGELLTAEGTANEIMGSENLECWWLQDNREEAGISNKTAMLNSEDKYSDGVIRKRCLSKALYHSTHASGSKKVEDMIDSTSGGASRTCMVAGIGGGTGSGIFLDLARDIKESTGAEITLFAIIPATDIGEGRREKANGYAVLSELEYLTLRGGGENPFYNIVLIPAEPSMKQESDTEDFFEAVAHSILAYYNSAGGKGYGNTASLLNVDNEDGPPQYAPFTVAVPQILRFSESEIEEARRDYEKFKDQFSEAHESEKILYEEIEEYIEEHYEDLYETFIQQEHLDQSVQVKDGTMADLHDSRLLFVEDMLSMDELVHLGHQNHEEILEEIEAAKDEIDGKVEDEEPPNREAAAAMKRDRRVVKLPKRYGEETDGEGNPLTPGETGFDRDQDNELADLVQKELKNIGRKYRILEVAERVDEEEVEEGIKVAVDREERGLAVDLGGRLSDAMRQLREEESKDEALDELKSEVEETIETEVSSWKSNVKEEFEKLIELNKGIDTVENGISDLESLLDDLTRAISQTENPHEVPAISEEFEPREFKDMNKVLEKIGVDTVDLSSIKNSLSNIKEAALVYHEDNSSLIPFVDDPILGSGSDEAFREYGERCNNVNDEMFRISSFEDPDFHCGVEEEYFEGKLESARGKRADFVESICGSLDEYVTNTRKSKEDIVERVDEEATEGVEEPSKLFDGVSEFGTDNSHTNSLKNWLQNQELNGSAESVLSSLCSSDGSETDNYVYIAFNEAYLRPVEKRIEQLEVDEYETKVNKYSNLKEIIDNEGVNFIGAREGVMDPEDIDIKATSDEEAGHIWRVTAQDQSRLERPEDIFESKLWDEETEKKEIVKRLNDFASRVGNFGEYAPIKEPAIESNRDEYNKDKYDDHRLFNVFMSRVFDEPSSEQEGSGIEGDSVRVKENMSESPSLYNIDEDNKYKVAKVDTGGPWDISMTTFVGGVFLDNLTPVGENGGYKDNYEDAAKDLRGMSLLIRHTHGIDGIDRNMREKVGNDGAWLHRASLIDTDYERDLGLILGKDEENDTVRRLLEDYIQYDGFESTVDVTWMDS